jgi:hypothetical protein
MQKYIGVKIITGEPMTAIEFNDNVRPLKYLGDSQEGYKVTYEDGYVSWSPKDVFENAYRHMAGLTFGLAVEAVKKGHKIARKGWNGKGMFVVYQKGYPQGIPSNKQTADAWGMNEGDLFKCEPYLQIQMVNGSHSMWVPSINDVLAEDWEVVE